MRSRFRFASPALVVALLLLTAGVAGAVALREDQYSTDVRVTAVPRLSAGDAVGLARSALDSLAMSIGRSPTTDVASVVAVAASDVASVEPDATVEISDEVRADRTLWVVKANGIFVSFRGRGPEALVGSSGYLIIDDAGGETVSMGFRLAQ